MIKKLEELKRMMTANIIKKEHSVGRFSEYTEYFECQKCKEAHIMDDHEYCSICGTKIIWELDNEND